MCCWEQKHCRHLQLPFIGVSWGVGIRFAYQLHILPVEKPVAIKALNSDFWLICRGTKKTEKQDGKGKARVMEKKGEKMK